MEAKLSKISTNKPFSELLELESAINNHIVLKKDC